MQSECGEFFYLANKKSGRSRLFIHAYDKYLFFELAQFLDHLQLCSGLGQFR